MSSQTKKQKHSKEKVAIRQRERERNRDVRRERERERERERRGDEERARERERRDKRRETRKRPRKTELFPKSAEDSRKSACRRLQNGSCAVLLALNFNIQIYKTLKPIWSFLFENAIAPMRFGTFTKPPRK